MDKLDFFKNKGQACASEAFVFALSTCVFCRRAKALLKSLETPFEFIDVDLVADQGDLDEVMSEMRKHNPSESFPTIVIGGRVVVGFLEDDIKSAVARLKR